jgi:WD40 repeat protein/tetratricopeptide (TPR) repeat protein
MSRVSSACPHCRAPLAALPKGPAPCPACGKLLAPAPPEPRWFYVRAKQKVGPVPLAELRARAEAGELRPADMVLAEGARRWVAAAAVPGLFDPAAVTSTPAPAIPAGAASGEPSGSGRITHGGDSSVADQLPPPAPPTAPALPLHELPTCSAATPVTAPPAPPTPAVTPQPTLPGYEILGVLGRGGMGIVYRARQIKAKRLVALKMILAGPHAAGPELARFRTEAEAVARLQHPHIVQIFEVGEHEGLPFFTLEYVEGGTLARKLAGTPLPPKEAAALGEALAVAMEAAHRAGVIHRDLKPANVLLTGDGTPKVADFGLAKALGEESGQTHTGAVMGTPSYMAPEQARGSIMEIGPPADVYALGAILYECLTGRPPFRAATVWETLEQVRGQEPVPPHAFEPKVPRDLETICLKCLHKEPVRRYPSAQALAEDLRRFRNHEPIRARPVGPWERAVKWARRRPAIAALIAAVVLVGVAGLTGILWKWREADQNAVTAFEALGKQKEATDDAMASAVKERKANEQLQLQLYVSTLHEAATALATNDTHRAEGLLLACPPALRGWEWHHLLRQCRAELFEVQGSGAAFLPDGKLVVASGQGIEAYDADSGRLVGSIPLQNGGLLVERLALSADGKRVAFCDGMTSKRVAVHDRATGKLLQILEGFREEVAAVALSPDGARLVTAGTRWKKAKDGPSAELKVWDVATGKVVLDVDVKEIRGAFRDACFRPDGKQFASAGEDGKVRLWDAATGKEVGTLSGHEGAVNAVVFGPDGQRLASGGDDRIVRIWDAGGLEPVRLASGHQGPVRAVAFSPDGLTVASAGGDRAVKVWDRMGRELATYRGHRAPVESVAFSPDGVHLASATATRSDIKVWDATTPPGSALPPLDDGQAVAFSSDGRRQVTGGRLGRLRVWERATGRALLTIEGPRGMVTALAFRPDGKEVAAATGFAAAGTNNSSLKFWDATTGRLVRALTLPAAVWAVQYSPDGSRLAVRTGSFGKVTSTVRVLEVSTGRELFSSTVRQENSLGCPGVAFSPDGRRLAIAGTPDNDAQAGIVDLATRRRIVTLSGHASKVLDLAWSGDRIATLGTDGSVKVWDAATGALRWTLPLPGESTYGGGLAFSNAGEGPAAKLGERLAAFDSSGQGKVWELTEGKEVLTLWGDDAHLRNVVAFSADGRYLTVPGPNGSTVAVLDGGRGPLALTLRGRHETGPFTAVAFSPDGRLLAGGHTRASLWDAATGEELDPLPPFPNSILTLAFSPDSRLLAAVTFVKSRPKEAGEVKVWDVAGRQEVLTFREHTAVIRDVAFSPDGRRIASASDDRTVKVWDPRTGKVEWSQESAKAGFTSVAFSPDDTRVAAAGSDRRIRVWEAAGGREVAVCGPLRRGDFGQVIFSPDGKYLVASSDKVTVWDPATGREVRALEGSPDIANKVAFSPDGKLLAAAGNNAVVVWGFASGREVLSYPVRGVVSGLAFSPDGRRLAVGDGENLDVWEVGERWQALAAAGRRDARERVKAWHGRQAQLALTAQEWFGARSHLSALIALEPNEGAHYLGRADANAELGRWAEAAADAARAVEMVPDSSGTWHREALLHLRAGDLARYRQTCDAMFRRLGQTKDWATLNDLVWVCCLGPGAASDPKSVVALAERSVPPGANADNLRRLGAALCRAGRHDEAVTRLREAVGARKGGGEPVDWFLLAMAHHHLNQSDRAREALEQGRSLQKKAPPGDWLSRLEVELLLAEAEKLLEETKP